MYVSDCASDLKLLIYCRRQLQAGKVKLEKSLSHSSLSISLNLVKLQKSVSVGPYSLQEQYGSKCHIKKVVICIRSWPSFMLVCKGSMFINPRRAEFHTRGGRRGISPLKNYSPPKKTFIKVIFQYIKCIKIPLECPKFNLRACIFTKFSRPL